MDNIQIAAVVIILLCICCSASISIYVMSSKKQVVTLPPITSPPTSPPTTLPQILPPTLLPRPTRATPTPTMASVKLPKIIDDINNKFSWQTMQNVGLRDVSELTFLRQCDKPWDAMYQIGCTIDGITEKSQIFGPVSSNNKQSPILRVGDYDENNMCAKLGGQLSVYRRRPNDKTMVDITSNLNNITNSQPYNKKDSLFIDDYNTDC